MVPCISVSMANSVAGFVPVSLREFPDKADSDGFYGSTEATGIRDTIQVTEIDDVSIFVTGSVTQ